MVQLAIWCAAREEYATLGGAVVAELNSESRSRRSTTCPGRSSAAPNAPDSASATASTAMSSASAAPTGPADPISPPSGDGCRCPIAQPILSTRAGSSGSAPIPSPTWIASRSGRSGSLAGLLCELRVMTRVILMHEPGTAARLGMATRLPRRSTLTPTCCVVVPGGKVLPTGAPPRHSPHLPTTGPASRPGGARRVTQSLARRRRVEVVTERRLAERLRRPTPSPARLSEAQAFPAGLPAGVCRGAAGPPRPAATAWAAGHGGANAGAHRGYPAFCADAGRVRLYRRRGASHQPGP